MSDFWTNFIIGLKHLWNIHAYIDILFLLALAVPYESKSWKRLLILVSLSTGGHTLALLLSVFNVVSLKSGIAAFAISLLVVAASGFNLLSAGKSGKKDGFTFIAVIASLFGIIHGLGFAGYFNHLIQGSPTDKLWPVFETSLGFGVSQIILVVLSLVIAYMAQSLLKFSKRDWILIVSSLAIGVLIPLIAQNEIWHK